MESIVVTDSSDALIPARAGPREWVGLGVIALPCVLYAMDLTVLNLAVPSLSASLNPTPTQLLWIVDVYGFVLSSMLITMGALGDRIGRRRLLLIGAAAFGVASILTAFATNSEMLIAMRAVLGLAGATLAPATLSLLRNMFHDPRQRAFAIGVWGSSFSAGAAIGPLIGGLLLEHFWWGSVFLISIPVMVLVLLLGPTLLPEYRDPKRSPIDLPSAVYSLVTVLAIIYGVKRLAEHGVSWLPLICISTGLMVGLLFVRRQTRVAEPMVDLRLFRSPAVTAALATYALACFVAYGLLLFVAQYLQLVLGLGPWEAGLWTSPFAAVFIVSSIVSPLFARRVRRESLMIAGLALSTLGFLMLSTVDTTTSPIFVTAALCTYGLGIAPVFTFSVDLIVGGAPPERAGVLSAIAETASELGGALGIALLGSIGAAMSRLAMARQARVHSADQGAGTLGAAVEAAHRIGGALETAALEASRSAYVHGMHVAAIVSAVILTITTAVVIHWLWRRPKHLYGSLDGRVGL